MLGGLVYFGCVFSLDVFVDDIGQEDEGDCGDEDERDEVGEGLFEEPGGGGGVGLVEGVLVERLLEFEEGG